MSKSLKKSLEKETRAKGCVLELLISMASMAHSGSQTAATMTTNYQMSTFSFAQPTPLSNPRSWSSTPSYPLWPTITQLKNWPFISPTTGAPSSHSMLLSKLRISPSIGCPFVESSWSSLRLRRPTFLSILLCIIVLKSGST